MKGVLILSTTEWANSTPSVIPAALKPFLIISGCLQRYIQIHQKSIVNIAVSAHVLTAAGHIPLTSCLLISSVNQALYLLEINDLAGLLTVSSRG